MLADFTDDFTHLNRSPQGQRKNTLVGRAKTTRIDGAKNDLKDQLKDQSPQTKNEYNLIDPLDIRKSKIGQITMTPEQMAKCKLSMNK